MHGLDGVNATHRPQLGANVADMAVDGAVGDMDFAGIGTGHHRVAVEHISRSRQNPFRIENSIMSARAVVKAGGMAGRHQDKLAVHELPVVDRL